MKEHRKLTIRESDDRKHSDRTTWVRRARLRQNRALSSTTFWVVDVASGSVTGHLLQVGLGSASLPISWPSVQVHHSNNLNPLVPDSIDNAKRKSCNSALSRMA